MTRSHCLLQVRRYWRQAFDVPRHELWQDRGHRHQGTTIIGRIRGCVFCTILEEILIVLRVPGLMIND